jgi:hypothetical protein
MEMIDFLGKSGSKLHRRYELNYQILRKKVNSLQPKKSEKLPEVLDKNIIETIYLFLPP